MRHKHPEITDPVLRQIFAKELWVLRSAMHKTGISMQSEWVYGIRLGFETALRRVQAWQQVNHA